LGQSLRILGALKVLFGTLHAGHFS
jgi:hypothetical protein